MAEINAQETLAGILANRQRRKAEESAEYKQIHTLQRRIKEGIETFGDPVKDFVLANYGIDNTNRVESYLGKLDETVQRMTVGQPALAEMTFVHTSPPMDSSRHSPSAGFTTNHTFLRFGYLTDAPRWDVNEGLVLPMERYSWSLGHLERRATGWDVQPHPIKLSADELKMVHDGVFYLFNYDSFTDKPEREDIPKEVRHLEIPHHHERGPWSARLSLRSGVDDIRKYFRDTRLTLEGKNGMALLAEALQVEITGKSVESYEQELEADLREQRLDVLDRLSRYMRRGDKDGISETLPYATMLGLDTMADLIEGDDGIAYNPSAVVEAARNAGS